MTGGGGNRGAMGIGKPHIPVTLICVDTTAKLYLAERAIKKCLEVATFDDVKFLTTDASRAHAVVIPPVNGIEAYSTFVVRELHKYFKTSHCLLAQWDGYCCNPFAWTNEFLRWDFGGAPWVQWNSVGNGGFSLRSQRMCGLLETFHTEETPHPEDSWISHRHRPELEARGIRFMPVPLAKKFAFEGRSWNGKGWEALEKSWSGQFGFHSWLTPLPKTMDKPLIFHHSGDIGDIIYSLATVKAMGGGMFFLSQDCRFPFPHAPRMCGEQRVERETANLAPLLEEQDYIWKCSFTHGLPFSTDVDFNAFREFYKSKSLDNFASLYSLQGKRFGVELTGEPWLNVEPLVPNEPKDQQNRVIVVNRTPRFQNVHFPWYKLVQDYGKLMTFVGTEAEYHTFTGLGGSVPWRKTDNLLDLARVIAGAKVFIGNQSTPMAIALGLGVNTIQEMWPANPNCIIKRGNCFYWNHQHGNIRIPDSWLK